MDTQNSTQPAELNPGSTVIYGLHGMCTVLGVEYREFGSSQDRFYKLEIKKPAASRSTRREPAIWVPVKTAGERGLRLPMSALDIESTYKILSSREYYFPLDESWSAAQAKIEATIRSEGGTGLAKGLSYLYVLKKKQHVPTPEVNRLYDQILKILMREICEARQKAPKQFETELEKMLRHKLLPNN